MNYTVLTENQTILEINRYDDEYQTWYTESEIINQPVVRAYTIEEILQEPEF
jgi:hypothetical protein